MRPDAVIDRELTIKGSMAGDVTCAVNTVAVEVIKDYKMQNYQELIFKNLMSGQVPYPYVITCSASNIRKQFIVLN